MAKTNSEQELSMLREQGKISQAEYKQLHAALQSRPVRESQPGRDTHPCPLTKELYAFRKRVLLTGFAICLIGLPIGLVLNLPLVWGLSIVGLIVVPIKLHLVNKKLHNLNQLNRSQQCREN